MKNIFDKITELKNLYSAWEKVRIIAKEEYIFNSYDVRYFNENIDSILITINYELINSLFKFETIYKFETPKKKNEKRIFHINTLKNMIVTQAIINIIGPLLEKRMIDESYGYRLDLTSNVSVYKDWSSQYNSFINTLDVWYKKYSEKDYTVLRYDVKGFFDNIRIDTLYNMIAQVINDPKTCKLIKDYLNINVIDCFEKREKGLPQGIYSSGFFANIYLEKFDRIMKDKVIGYARYVDDIFLLVDSLQKSEVNSIIDRELNFLLLEKNNDKYREVNIQNYFSLINMGNELKYNSIHFFEEQYNNLTSEEKNKLFTYIEQKLAASSDLSLTTEDFKDYSEHLNFLLFLNKNLNDNDNTLLLALEVLKYEAVKYNKLEKIFKNLFSNDLGQKVLINKINEYPYYIKLSLAKFLLNNNEYKFSKEFVNTYLHSSDYLLLNSGLLLYIKLDDYSNLQEIPTFIDNIECVYKKSFIIKYFLQCLIYENKDILEDKHIDKYFCLKTDMIMFYLYHFEHIEAISNLYQLNHSEDTDIEALKYFIYEDNFSVLFLVKMLFACSDYSLYKYILENLNNKLVYNLAKREILSYLYLEEEKEKYNIEKLVKLYNEILTYTDEWSILLCNELKSYISDFQKSRNREFVKFDTDKYPLTEDIKYESIITKLFIEVNDIEYLQVMYKNRKYILERINKAIFRDKSDYNMYINQIDELKRNGLTVNFIELVKYTDDYKYTYTLYEVENFNQLLWNKLKIEQSLELDKFYEIITALIKYHKVLGTFPVSSTFNILLDNNLKFVCIFPQLRYSSYISINAFCRDITNHKSIESFGYLLLENYHFNNFLEITRKRDFDVYFKLPHINSILNKIFTDKDFRYKHIDNLKDDFGSVLKFNNFIEQVDSKNTEIINKMIIFDYIGFKTIQYKRYLDTVNYNNIAAISDCFERIIKRVTFYLRDKNIILNKCIISKLWYKMRLKNKKVNIYSISVVLAVIVLFKSSFKIIKEYGNTYSFKGFIQFLNFMLSALSHVFELESRYKYDNEIAACSLPNATSFFNDDAQNCYKEANVCFNYYNSIEILEGSDKGLSEEYFNIPQKINIMLINLSSRQIKNRYYGKLFINGIILSIENKSDITIKIKRRFLKRKDKITVDKIDSFHKNHIRISCDPYASLEYSNGSISNVNIESISARNFLNFKRPHTQVIKKIKEITKLIIIFLILTFAFGYLVYLLTGSKAISAAVASVATTILSVLYKELISPFVKKAKVFLGLEEKQNT